MIDLASIEQQYEAVNGDVLTGMAGRDTHITIAAGAVVTLKDVFIVVSGDDWAGITCLGDATLVLKGSNTVKTLYGEYPAVFPAEGSTLCIKGTGSLQVSCGGKGAGIGGGFQKACGNITITKDVIHVTAIKGDSAQAIGCGYNSSCGTITIEEGANVTLDN